MKKFFLMNLILSIFSFTLFAQNLQDSIPLDSAFYKALDSLYLEAGFVPPSGSRPYSRAEAQKRLLKIKTESLSEQGKKLYEFALSKINFETTEKTDFAYQIKFNPAVEFYSHVPLNQYSLEHLVDYTWTYGYKDRLALLNMPMTIWAGNDLSARFDLKLTEDYRMIDNTYSPIGFTNPNVQNTFINIPSEASDFDTLLPFRGTINFGNNVYALEFGRNTASWGNGQSGNFIISNNLDFLDALKFKLFTDSFTFTSIYSVFQPDLSLGQVYEGFTAHRLEFVLFEKAEFAITEAISFGGPDSIPHLIHDLNPVTIYHGWLAPERANSLMQLEASYTPFKFFTLYTQVAIDEFQTKAETDAASFTNATATGVLAGVSMSVPFLQGFLNGHIEAAKTDPWLYNRRAAPYYHYQRRVWSFIEPACDEWIIKPLGYFSGPDSIVLNTKIEYFTLDTFSISLNYVLLMQGEVTLASTYPLAGSTDFALVTPSGIPEITNSISVKANYKLFDFLTLFLHGNLNFINEKNHILSQFSIDSEFAFGIQSSF